MLIKNWLLAVGGFFFMNFSYAGAPVWTFTPLTATTVSVPVNGTASVQYQLTNQSSRPHTLVMNSTKGVTQLTNGAGVCGNPFTLSGHDSCILSLQITGSQILSGNTNGPVVCEQGSNLQCYRPDSANTLNVTVTDNQYSLGGSISGLTGTVYLQNNGGSPQAFSTNGVFTLATGLTNGSSYAVTIQSQPVDQTCSVSNGTGVINDSNVTNVTVTCSTNAYTVGGTVSGLTGSVVLLNNGGDADTIQANGAFTFSMPVAEGSAYNVTVGTQPSGQTCTVTNGTGTMGSGNVTDVNVACANSVAILSTSIAPPSVLALSVNQTSLNQALTGNARHITIQNTGTAEATGLSITYPAWPQGTTASSTCGATLAAGDTCTITVTPGANATSDCNTGIAPTPGIITVSATNVATAVTSNVEVLSYGCQYQGGYVYAVNDTTPTSGSIGGKVVTLTDQATFNSQAIPWSTSVDSIYGISEISTTSSPNPAQGEVTGQTACNGNIDGSCDSHNIYVYYQPPTTDPATDPSSYATGLCKALINGYNDWYLPASSQNLSSQSLC